MTGPGVAETATTFMVPVVIGSHERARFKFHVSLLGVVSCKGAANSLDTRVSLPSSSSVSFVVTGVVNESS